MLQLLQIISNEVRVMLTWLILVCFSGVAAHHVLLQSEGAHKSMQWLHAHQHTSQLMLSLVMLSILRVDECVYLFSPTHHFCPLTSMQQVSIIMKAHNCACCVLL